MKKKVKKGVKKAARKKPVKKVKRRVIKRHVKRHPKKLSGKKPKKHVKRPVKRIKVKKVRKAAKRSSKKSLKRVIKKPIQKQPKKAKRRIRESPVKESLKSIPEDFIKKSIEKDYEDSAEEEKKEVEEKPKTGKYHTEYIKQFFERSAKRYYKGLFSKTYGLVKKKREIFQKTLGLDLLFFLILVVLLRGAARFIPRDTSSALYLIFGVPLVFTAAILLFLLGVFIYSLIKYRILFVIESILENVRFNLERFDKFFILNCIILGIEFLAFVIMYTITQFVDSGVKPLIWIVFALITVFVYSFINISHWLYAHEPKFRKTVRRTLVIMAEGFGKYIGIAGLTFGVVITYSLIAFAIGSILKIAGGDIVLHKRIAAVIGGIIFYVTIAYSRICFYFTVEKLKNEIKD